MATLEFYYDVSSPWTYLAFVRVIPLAERCNAKIDWKPILVGGVFNAVNPEVYAHRDAMFSGVNPRRSQYYQQDLDDWADYCGVHINVPDFHPARSVKAMRGCLVAAEQEQLIPFSLQLFEAYFGNQQDINDDTVLSCIAQAVGIEDFHTKIGNQAIKDQLRANTDEVIERGAFGSPTLFVGNRMFFGNDRLPLVEHALLSASQ